jgi:hypothetical protein
VPWRVFGEPSARRSQRYGAETSWPFKPSGPPVLERNPETTSASTSEKALHAPEHALEFMDEPPKQRFTQRSGVGTQTYSTLSH